jgi:hypothetical protein
MLTFLLYSLTILAIATSGCAGPIDKTAPMPDPTTASSATGVLTGVITRGPTSPVEVQGPPASAAAAGVRVDIATDDGKPVTSAPTDSAGRYRVSLAPGSYRVTIEPGSAAMFTKDLPARVTIAAGEQKQLDIHLDTGIR